MIFTKESYLTRITRPAAEVIEKVELMAVWPSSQKNDIKVKVLAQKCDFFCGFKVAAKEPVTLLCVYNPPSARKYRKDLALIYNRIQAILKTSSSKKMIVCGDFNLPNVTWETYSANDAETDVFLSLMMAIDFDQLIREPTHRKGNILDLIFANYKNVHMKPPLSTNFSDYLAVQFLLSVSTEPQNNMRQINMPCLPFQSHLPLAEIVEQNIF